MTIESTNMKTLMNETQNLNTLNQLLNEKEQQRRKESIGKV